MNQYQSRPAKREVSRAKAIVSFPSGKKLILLVLHQRLLAVSNNEIHQVGPTPTAETDLSAVAVVEIVRRRRQLLLQRPDVAVTVVRHARARGHHLDAVRPPEAIGWSQ